LIETNRNHENRDASGRYGWDVRRGGELVDDVPRISSERLDLVWMSPPFIEALLGGRRLEAARLVGAVLPDGWPDAHDERFLRMRLEQMQRESESRQWLVRAIVLREDGAVVGHAGFHGPPGVNARAKPDALEVGYTIFPPYRDRGYATEAARALIGWARDVQGIRGFFASVDPANEQSLAIVRKLGFVHQGERWDDEDGLELVFELTLR
jgi:RimJ/RimL family protein N-acetyltransferase